MNQEQFVELISEKMKLIRIEKDLTQDEAAGQLGISKKTLIQIEKGRKSAGWTVAVAFCTLYRDSELLNHLLGDQPLEMIDLIIKNGHKTSKESLMGGELWWRDMKKKDGYVLQQNVVSQHFRITDHHNRLYSTFQLEDAEKFLKSL